MLMVTEIMTREVITLKPDMTAEHAAWVLTEHHIGGAPVLDDGNHLVGMLSKSDLIDPEHDGDRKTEIKKIMATTVPAVRTDSTALEAVQFMAKHGLERVIVVNQVGLVMGILTPMDIVKAIDGGKSFADHEVLYQSAASA